MPSRAQSSQSSQNQNHLVGPISLPLSKFSYATVSAESTTPIPWTHLSSHGNLFVAFDITRMQRLDGGIEEQSELKIVNGSDRLDVLQLDILGKEAMKAKTTSSTMNQYSTTIIVRVPCLAIRYPLDQQQVRRIQMRFTKETDYYRALQLLSEAGCPLEPAAAPQTRPQSRPLSSASTVIGNGREDPNTIHTVSKNPADGATVKKSQNSGNRLSNTALESAPYLERSTPSFIERPNPHLFENVQPQYVQLGKLASESWLSAERHLGEAPLAAQVDQFHTSPMKRTAIGDLLYAPRPSTAPVVQSQGAISRMLPPPRDLPFRKPIMRTTSDDVKQLSVQPDASSRFNEKVKSRDSDKRPHTASAIDRGNTPSQVQTSSKRAHKAPSAPRKKPRARQKTPVPSVDEILARDQVPEPRVSSRPVTAIASSPEDQTIGVINETHPSHGGRLQGSLCTDEIDGDVVLVKDSQPEVSNDANTTSFSKESLPGQRDRTNLSSYLSRPSTRPVSQISESLRASDLSNYAMDDKTSQADRLAAIETFVCAQLKDDGFLRLVKDLETWWPRLLLGKRTIDLDDAERDG